MLDVGRFCLGLGISLVNVNSKKRQGKLEWIIQYGDIIFHRKGKEKRTKHWE